MKQGRFVDQGPPDQIFTPEKLTAVFGCPVHVRRIHGRYWPEVLPEAWIDVLATEKEMQSG